MNTPSHKCDGFSAKPRANVPASRPRLVPSPNARHLQAPVTAATRERAFPSSPERDSPPREF